MEGSGTTTTPTEPPADASEVGSVPPEDLQGDPGQGEGGDRDESGRYLSAEARRYRVRLRETEAERDALREQLDRLQTAEVERIATGSGLAVASDVWLHGASLDTLRTEDGAIDPQVVEGLVADLVKDRPGLKAPVIGDAGIGRGASASGRHPVQLGLSQLLKP